MKVELSETASRGRVPGGGAARALSALAMVDDFLARKNRRQQNSSLCDDEFFQNSQLDQPPRRQLRNRQKSGEADRELVMTIGLPPDFGAGML